MSTVVLKLISNEPPLNARLSQRTTRRSKAGDATPASGASLDRELVDQCLGGDEEAWRSLFDSHQPGLLSAIQAMLGRHRSNVELVEEIAARVWCALALRSGILLDRFDAHRGCRLSTFLAAVANNEIRQHWRSETRRRNRERTAARSKQYVEVSQVETSKAAFDDFLTTLTPRELAFFFEVLISAPDTLADGAYTKSNTWQLRHRVLRKLEAAL